MADPHPPTPPPLLLDSNSEARSEDGRRTGKDVSATLLDVLE